MEALAVVVDVVFVQLCGAGDLIVAVDAGRDEGQHCALRSHEGAFQAAEQDGGAVHLTIAHGKAQGRAVGRAAGVVGGEGIVEQDGAVLIVHRFALTAVEAGTKAELAGLVELGVGERAAQVGHLIAHQLEHCGAGFFQRDGIVRTEAAVGVAIHPALLHGDADIGRPCRGAGQVGVRGSPLPPGKRRSPGR